MAAVCCCCCCILAKIGPCLAASCCWCCFFKVSSSTWNSFSFSVFSFKNPLCLHLVCLHCSPSASVLFLSLQIAPWPLFIISLQLVCLPQSSLGLHQNLWILLQTFLDLLFHQLKFQVQLHHLLQCHLLILPLSFFSKCFIWKCYILSQTLLCVTLNFTSSLLFKASGISIHFLPFSSLPYICKVLPQYLAA